MENLITHMLWEKKNKNLKVAFIVERFTTIVAVDEKSFLNVFSLDFSTKPLHKQKSKLYSR